jgi:hypothetical protein
VQTYKLYKTEFEVSSLTILVCVTNLHSDLTITPFVTDKKKNITKFKQEKGVKKNGWIYYRYELSFDSPTTVRGIYLYLENISQKMVKGEIIIILRLIILLILANFQFMKERPGMKASKILI